MRSELRIASGIMWGALLALGVGCKPPEELIMNTLNTHLEACKASSDEFVEITLSGGSVEPILRQACSEPVTGLRIEDKISATATTGPYTWTLAQQPGSGVWGVENVAWRELTDTRRVLEDKDDPDGDALRLGVERAAAAQAAYPKSPWVHHAHMQLLLNLRKKTRNQKDAQLDDITGLGAEAQTYYDGLLAWSKEQNDAALAAHARLMVIDYFKGYERFLDTALETMGGGDYALEKSIEVAEKEGDKAKAQVYREELEANRATREGEAAALTERKGRVRERLCAEIAALSADGIEDDKLKERAVAAKSGTPCGAN